MNTTSFDGYNWNLSESIYNRIVKILRNKKAHNILYNLFYGKL